MNQIGFNPNINFSSNYKTQSPKTYNVLYKQPENKKSGISEGKLLALGLMVIGGLLAIKNIKLLKKIIPQAKKEFIPIENIPGVNNPKRTIVLNKHETPIQVKVPDVVPKKNIGHIISDEEYLSGLFNKMSQSWKKDGKVAPDKIDEILTKHVGGEKWTREIKFYTDEKRGIYAGRKKSYKTRNGNIFVLEAHTGRNGIETRCYLAIGSDRKPLPKDKRLYLCPDGIFEPGQYFGSKTHLASTDDAVNWIKQSFI